MGEAKRMKRKGKWLAEVSEWWRAVVVDGVKGMWYVVRYWAGFEGDDWME